MYFYFSFYCQPTRALTYDIPARLLRVADRKFVEGDFKSRHFVVTELNARPEVHTVLHWTSCVSEEAETYCKWHYFVNRVRPSGHYMHRTVITIRTAQGSLYVPHRGHYTYRTLVIIRTAQWSLYGPHSGHYMYCTVVTIYATNLIFNNSAFCPHNVFVCFVWISEQTAIISLHNINRLVFITDI